jgi:hypothetical protein
MSKLKNIIKQLSEKDLKVIYDSLLDGNAEKSAYLLKSLRERQLSDAKIMAELGVNPNAYYTLRSRLNQKIEEHLLQQMESPRTDLLRKVANLNEVLFSQNRTISIATLKKLEKELTESDLANELTIVYKSLKKLHINSSDFFHYSQLYNRHVAYMLAVDKAEDLLAEYAKKYGVFIFSADESEKLSLTLLVREMQNVARLYESHRLYVYQGIMVVFHRLFVEKEDNLQQEGESMEDIFERVQKIFDTYKLDPLYYHINLVFEFLKLEYYNHYKVYRQAEKFYEEVNDAASSLLENYSQYAFTSQFLISKVERHLRLGTESEMQQENESAFEGFEQDASSLPNIVVFVVYKALSSYYVGKFDVAAKLLNSLLNDTGLKKYPYVLMEIKTMLALQYCLLRDFDLFTQISNSIQRQLRLLGTDDCENVLLFLKILKVATSDAKRDKKKKIAAVVSRLKQIELNYFAPTRLIKLDDTFIKALAEIDPPQ